MRDTVKKNLMDALIYFHMINNKKEYLLDNFNAEEIKELQVMIHDFYQRIGTREMEDYAQTTFKKSLRKLLKNAEGIYVS
jgi:hypothetical protein